MFKNLLLPISFLFLLSCAAPKREFTRADLKPVVKYYAINKAEAPQKPMYSMTLYNDFRLELQAYSGLDRTGAYTTMLNKMEFQRVEDLLKKINQGHTVYHHPTESISYDILYLPLKKDISMAYGKVLQNETTVVLFNSEIDDFIKYKNWYKKEDAPTIFGDVTPNELILSTKIGTDAAAIVKTLEAQYGTKIIQNIDKSTNTWLISYTKGSMPEVIQAFRRNDDVVGLIENMKMNVDKNMAIFGEQELIVQCKEAINLEEWVKTYAAQKMKAGRQVAPNLTYYTVSFDSSTLSAKELIALIKKDTKVKEAQVNKKVLPRE
jgi:hypothetical protein